MKRGFKGIVFILIAFLLVGCTIKSKENYSNVKEEGKEEKKIEFEMKLAENIVNNYMGALISEDVNKMSSLYSKTLSAESKMILPKSLKCKGFKIEEMNQIGNKGNFIVKSIYTDMEQSLAILESTIIEVINEENRYVIDKIIKKQEKEVFKEGNTLRVRSEQDIKTNLVIDNSGLPKYASSRDDDSGNYKIEIPKEAISSLNINYSGDKICFSKGKVDSYVAVVQIDYTLATQAQGEDDKESGNGGPVSPREKPIGKKVVSIDYLMDTQVQFAVFSLEEEHVVVQYNKPGDGRFIRIYDTCKGQLIKTKLEDEFPMEKVEIVFSSVDKGVVKFEVLSKGGLDMSKSKVLGMWQIDLKTSELKKL